MTSDDIAAIERATVAAVAPEAIEELAPWLLAFDAGVVGRAKSAVPLRFHDVDPATIPAIEARYAARGLPASFRIAGDGPLAPIRDVLAERGYRAGRPTFVQIAPTAAVQRVAAPDDVRFDAAPDAAWTAAFLGEGFDPVEGASRARTLARASGTLFASVREDGVAIGAGALSIAFGWASIHGMRTAKARRGEGIAGRILAAMAGVAAARALPRMFLQVEAHNAAAISLYARAGFETAWDYAYWER